MSVPIKNEDKYLSRISAGVFIIAVIFNLSGAIIANPGRTQNICWEISSLCAVAGYATIAAKLVRDGHDLVASGFAILLVAEGFAIASVSNPDRLDAATFGACIALYLPGFLIIGIFSHFKWWTRLAAILLCIPFGIEAFNVLNGTKISFEHALQAIGYSLQMVVFIGLAVELLKRPLSKKSELIAKPS